MIVGIHHVAISVPDLEKAAEFYVGLLGFEEVQATSWDRNFPEGDAAIGLKDTAASMKMLKGGNAYIELWEYANPAPKEKPNDYPPSDHGIAHFALQVKDIDAEYERLSEGGMRFAGPPVHFEGNSAAIYGRDPFGNIIEIYEVPEGMEIPST